MSASNSPGNGGPAPAAPAVEKFSWLTKAVTIAATFVGVAVAGYLGAPSHVAREPAGAPVAAPVGSPIMIPVLTPAPSADGIDSIPALNFRISRVKEQLQSEDRALEKQIDEIKESRREERKEQLERELRMAKKIDDMQHYFDGKFDKASEGIEELLRRTPKRTERAQLAVPKELKL
jgi:hypothetical protein